MQFGKAFKIIRQSRSLSQSEVSKNTISRTSLSQIEHGKQKTTYDNALALINNLGISVGEFEYIKNGYKRDAVEEIIYRFEHLSDSTEEDKMKKLLSQAKEVNIQTPNIGIQNIIRVLTALLNIDTFDDNKLHSLVSPIWDTLEKIDTWTTLDLYLINNILYFFKLSTAQNIVKFSLKRIETNFPHLVHLKNAFLLNDSYLSMKAHDVDYAKKCLKESMQLSKAIHRYDLFLLGKIRWDMLSSEINDAYKCKEILNFIDASNLVLAVEHEFPELK